MTAGRKNSSNYQDWNTPPKYADAIEKFFGGDVELDPCSNKWSMIKTKTKFELPEKDGLTESWNYKTIFVNPPYGRNTYNKTTIKNWMHKIYDAHKSFGSEVLCLIPVSTNTKHWKEYIFGKKAKAICFLFDTRLKFFIHGKESPKGSPMSCAMVYYGHRTDNFHNVFSSFGAIVYES